VSTSKTDDVLDVLSGPPVEPDDEQEKVVGDVHVCAFIDGTGDVCGASFDTAAKLNMHTQGKHRDRSNDKPREAGGRKTADKKPGRARATKTAPKAAAAQASAPRTDRAMLYTSSIATFALGAYVVVPPFDGFDLEVVTKSAPNVGAALAQVAENDKRVAAALDMALGGGTGGVYLQLLLAMAVPVAVILAHHGAIPSAAGAKFGEMLGVVVPAPASEPAPTPEQSAPDGYNPADHDPTKGPVSAEDVMRFMEQVPETVMVEVAGKMMGNMQPTVVNVPDSVAFYHPEKAADDGREPGPEQLKPEYKVPEGIVGLVSPREAYPLWENASDS
jgi:hypothetical protein